MTGRRDCTLARLSWPWVIFMLGGRYHIYLRGYASSIELLQMSIGTSLSMINSSGWLDPCGAFPL
jgi:hypothetical protein